MKMFFDIEKDHILKKGLNGTTGSQLCAQIWAEPQISQSYCGPRSSTSCDMVAEQKIHGCGVNSNNPVADLMVKR